MMVVMILLIAGALAAPRLGNIHVTRLSEAAKLLAADLAYAQTESMAHADDPRLVIFDTAAHAYRIAPTSDPDTPITNPVGGLPYLTTLGQGRAKQLQGVTIQSYSLDGDDRIAFGIYGQIDQATDATVTLAAADKTITVTINAISGEATIGNIN